MIHSQSHSQLKNPLIKRVARVSLLAFASASYLMTARAATFTWAHVTDGYHFNDVEYLNGGPLLIRRNNWGYSGSSSDAVLFPGPQDDVLFPSDTIAGGSAQSGVRNLINRGRLQASGTITLTGDSIDNQGQIQLDGGSSGGSLSFLSDAMLSGGGEILALAPNSSTFLRGPGSLTVEPGNRIRGHGSINVDINNRGAIHAQGGILSVGRNAIDNAEGRIVIEASGDLRLNGSGNSGQPPSSITGGVIEGKAGSGLAGWTGNAYVEDVTFIGAHRLYDSLQLRGTITNLGKLGFVPNANNAYYEVVSNVTLEGFGELWIDAQTQDRVGVSGRGTLRNGIDHTIVGNGALDVHLINDGAIYPGLGINAAGQLFGDRLTNTSDGLLHIEIGGTIPGATHDRLWFNQIDQNGALFVDLIDNYTPEIGDVYEIARADDFFTGKFSEVQLPSLPSGMNWQLRERNRGNAHSLELLVVDLLRGDANGDGNVDLLDLDILGTNFGRTSVGYSGGDFNGDNVVDLLDLDILGSEFGPVSGEMVSIPEPNATTLTIVLLVLSGSIVIRNRRTGGVGRKQRIAVPA